LFFTALRTLLNLSRRQIKGIERKKTIYKWEKSRIPPLKQENRTAHLLVVKNLRYVSISRICVSSFLHFNSNYNVLIHCDYITYKSLIEEFSKSRFSPIIEISMDQNNSDTWQRQKLNVIMKLNGSADIFMDADLRWNSALEQGNGITFLTCEYEMSKRSPLRQIARGLEGLHSNPCMYNSSYFSFGGCEVSVAQIDQLQAFFDEFEKLLIHSDIGEEDVLFLRRLSEQIALSLHAASWVAELDTLKLEDSPRDGGVVESTYFGATGDSF
jgi:hypothetical protein